MKKKDCEGCLTLDEEVEGDCPWYNEDLICPCSICLIKVMCSTYCNQMKEYIDSPK
jgi:hypothetical protein